ncbi:MAG: hypothetical protein B6229_00810 [Spirochaetaceae bacterium 4572_7]|nr:MAG: hypothetical protein B6229_00810 [Spirochaetaceae bacterium 4572_7]
MKKLNSIVALLLLNTLLFGDVLDMVSPQLAASSSYYNTSRSTTVAITNPALTADIQRYTFDFSYLFLKGLTGSEEGFGQVINLGGAMPSKYGVLSSAANLYLTNGLSSSDLNVGTTGNININFSKEIYSDLYFGMGLSTLLGSDSTGFDWGLGLNLGFVRNSGSVHKYINDLRWGVALKNLGKGYRNSGDFFNPVVPIFTPSAFGSFSPYKNDFLKVNVVSEISVPTVSNLVLNLGAGLEIFDNINIDTSLSVNVKDFVNGDFNRVIPSIFIGYNMNIKTYEDIQFSLAATPYTDGIWAFGGGGTMPLGKKDTTPPTVNIDYSATQYISPNFDGIKDELLFPVDVTDDRYIAGYEFTITDTFGRIIKKIVNKEERPENESFSNLFHKLISPKTGTPVPENFRWDGKRDNGDLTPDGEYRFYTKFTDDNGNRTITKTEDFIIDTTNPTLEIEAPTGLGLIFSPNGDGNKDFLKIPQTGSKEQLWYGEISDFMGNTVRIKSWEKQALSDFEWDGKDDLGQLVPDGVYEYRVYSTDRAGNSSEESVDNIIINTKQPPIGITIDTNSFSPNGDGVKDYMEFVLDIPVKTGIIEWELSIKNKAGTEVNKFSTKTQGYSIIEDNIRFNGDNLQGNILAEGSYFGELTVLYQNGHNPTVESPLFEIDKTAPSASVTALYPMFSPNGDNSKDSISFKQFSSNEDDWKGDIYDEFGTLVFETEWKGNIESKFLWNGKNSDGKLLDNGIFTYVLSSTDKSGNSYKGKPTAFELNNSKTAIELTLSKNALSTKKIGDSVQLIPTIVSDIKLSSFKVEIVTEEGKVVKDISNSGTVDSNFKWNGLGFSGAKVPDSKYFGRIIGEFENGNKITSLTSELLVDSLDPTATVKLKEKFSIFSPNGDGKKDSLTFIQSTSFEDKWIGRVKDSNGKSVFEATWSGKAPNEFEFSGKDLDNKNLTDGRYTYLLTAIDSAGNIGKSKEIAIDIDTEDVALFVSTNFTHFSPNGDRVKDTLTFIPNIKKSDGIEGLTYEISDNAGNILYSKDIGL